MSEIIEATGTISLREHPINIPGRHEIKDLLKNSHIFHCTYCGKC
jgi:hypothetical protein